MLFFGEHNQTVTAFQLVIWWVQQPYFLARILTTEFQVFPVNIQWISKTSYYEIKKKLSRHSKPKLCSTFKKDFDDNEKKE